MVLMADHWPDDVRLSNIEMRFVCPVCGKRGADIRPNSIGAWDIADASDTTDGIIDTRYLNAFWDSP